MAGRVREKSLGEGARELSPLPPPPDPHSQPRISGAQASSLCEHGQDARAPEKNLSRGWEGTLGGRGISDPPTLPSNLTPLFSLQPGRAALLWGESIRSPAAAAAAWAAARGLRVLAVDAANVFDPYRLVREAVPRGVSPRQALNRVRVARAFTCHQLVRLVQEELTRELAPGSLVLMLGPVSLFYDEQIPLAERRRLFQNLVQTLTAVKTRHPLLLLQPYLPEKIANRGFGRMLMPVAEVIGEFGGGPGDLRPPALPQTPS
ncbi:MAG: hypothetical protein QME75_08005, partial [Deltaproteobacteria bacterium]|nr:hypothetical protein [Deltaproteobacteria bacterium]